MSRPIFRQRPVRGGRDPLPACVLGPIKKWVDTEARTHRVSRSFVVATLLAEIAAVKGQEDYRTVTRRRGKKHTKKERTR